MHYLSFIQLNPNAYWTQKELKNPYQLHRSVVSMFDGERALYRVETNPTVTITTLSQTQPDMKYLLEKQWLDYRTYTPVTVKEYNVTVPQGAYLRFKLSGNPSAMRNGKRKGLYQEEDQYRWLKKQADRFGFRLHDQQILHHNHNTIGFRDNNTFVENCVVTFVGLLEVVDTDKFHRGLYHGIGHAKAFGCGLLSIAPV